MRRRTKQSATFPLAATGQDRRAVTGSQWLALCLVAAALVWAYWPALNGGFLWDDSGHVTKPELRSWGGLYRIWFEVGATQQYYPLLHTTFWIEHCIWGDRVPGYHLVNLFEHAIATGLVLLILRKLKIPGALLAAAIFALHPVQVESVAWISEQKNTLSAVFYLSAMRLYLDYYEHRRVPSYIGSLTLFILGLLTKTVTATLPAALLLIFWWQRGKLSWRRDVRPLVAWFVLGLIAGLFTAWVERSYIGAEGESFDLSALQRILLAGRAIWFYLANLVWPTNLIFIYPRWNLDPRELWQWMFPLAAMIVTIGLWLVRLRWRGPLAGWLFFVGTLFPALGFFNVYPFIFSFVADHFQYLASLGIIVPVIAGLTLLCHEQVGRFWKEQIGAARVVGVGLSVMLLSLLSILTWQQSRNYGDVFRLYQATIERNPDCWLACNNLGLEMFKAGKYENAIGLYQQALKVKPDYAATHNNWGLALEMLGRSQEAVTHYQEATRIQPGQSQAFFDWGYSLANQGQLAAAIDKYRQAIEIKPNYTQAHYSLANALARMGQVQQAIEEFQTALRLQNDYPDAHCNLALALVQVGRPGEAIEHYREAVRLQPDFPEAEFGWGSLLVNERPREAIEHLQKALRLKPNYPQALANLAQAYAVMGQAEQADATAEKAITLSRQDGQSAFADRMERWLKNYRSHPSAWSEKTSPDANLPGSEAPP